MLTPHAFRVFVPLFLLLGLFSSVTASAETFHSKWEMSCAIRNDKFNYVLPSAMRRNNVDMWIVIDNGRGTEPLKREFGIESAYGQGIYIFYDAGGDRIERYSLGGPGFSDLIAMCNAYDQFPEFKKAKGDEERSDLQSFVFDRDPKTIALNYLTGLEGEGTPVGNGLSHVGYQFLAKELGKKYAKRFVSSKALLSDYHGEHVASELIEFAKVGDITRTELERALSSEVITPGKTTYLDVARWLEERREALGLRRTWYPGVAFVDPVFNGYQELSENGVERVIQRGDTLFIDWGVDRNNFASDIKRFAYVLKEGEVGPPEDLVKAWKAAMEVREIIRKNVRVGKSGTVQYEELKQHIRDAGYVYAEEEEASDAPGIEVNVEMHGMGNIAHDVVAGLFQYSPKMTDYEIRPNAFLSLEFRLYAPAKARRWKGNKIVVAIEENVVITERGVEWLYPPQDRILLIR